MGKNYYIHKFVQRCDQYLRGQLGLPLIAPIDWLETLFGSDSNAELSNTMFMLGPYWHVYFRAYGQGQVHVIVKDHSLDEAPIIMHSFFPNNARGVQDFFTSPFLANLVSYFGRGNDIQVDTSGINSFFDLIDGRKPVKARF